MDVYDEVDRRETDALWNKTEVFEKFLLMSSTPIILTSHTF